MVAIILSLMAVFAPPSQQLPVDPARDRELGAHVAGFSNGQQSLEQLEKALATFAREFEKSPYRIGGRLVDWDRLPEEKTKEVVVLIGKLAAPAHLAFFRGDLTAAQAATKIAPFYGLFAGYGLDPPPGADASWYRRRDELINELGRFQAP